MNRFLFAVMTLATLVVMACGNDKKAKVEAASGVKRPTVTDPRDGRVYRTISIDSVTWMAENLNAVTDSSWCYDHDPANCEKYGRLYNLDTAIKACAGLGSGWRLPDDLDWDALEKAMGDNAGTKLKSKTGWEQPPLFQKLIVGTDDIGFSALPGGHRYSGDRFTGIGIYGYWWSASPSVGRSRVMYYHREFISAMKYDGSYGFSVRCVHRRERGGLTGDRSRASIQRVIMQDIATLRKAYNKRLRDNPELQGKIIVKFTINESGKVISAEVTESTINDQELENIVVERVMGYDFGEIHKYDDKGTVVTYPFVFTPN